MRLVNNFNQDWLFIPTEATPEDSDSLFEKITLPHTNKLFPQWFVDNAEYQFVSTYRKHFSVGQEVVNKQVFIDFEGVMLKSTVYLNGHLLGVHQGGYTPFSFEVSTYLVQDDNLLTVYVDATEDASIPPYGGRVDYLTFGGLYRDVWLRVVDPSHIVEVFAKPLDVLANPRVECEIGLSQLSDEMTLEVTLEDADSTVIAQQQVAVESTSPSITLSSFGPIALWQLENPTLYQVVVALFEQGILIDQVTVRIGFRTAAFSKDGNFYLNGQPLKLIGLNRHQSYPYIGVAAPARLQQLDAEIIKHELGCNIVRTSHYPQSSHFLNRCDEIGLLVFEELAGWQHIGDAEWQALAMCDMQRMIERDRNHPAIVLWGVRINESPDDEAFYTKTNALAHDLDPTRQTGGVRNFIESHQLEDVFTLNDFPEGIQTPRSRPHLITEFGGHMYPTKTWDQEERRVEHALVHARKHSLQLGHPDLAGAIGWCAFDYHTHREFGSGDRVCYHGVMDMFRLPKLAAYFYRSQKSPSAEVVLHAATNWTMGDRSGGGNNPLIIFSNCDEVEVLIGEELQGRFLPDSAAYPHLPHPPFVIRWPDPYNPWGTEFWDLTVNGYINGQRVAQHKIAADHLPCGLQLESHTSSLKADGMDMARLSIRVVDNYGNTLPYQNRIVQVSLTGEAELVGENPLVLLGGQSAIYLKARYGVGPVMVTAQTAGLPPSSITLQIEA